MVKSPFNCIKVLALGKGLEPLYPESKSGALTVVLTEQLKLKSFKLFFNSV